MADKEAERLKFETEVLQFTALVAAGAGGGSISLILGDFTLLRLGLAGLGFLGTLALTAICWRLGKRIRMLIEQIKEEI
jgi:hypothetical protein